MRSGNIWQIAYRRSYNDDNGNPEYVDSIWLRSGYALTDLNSKMPNFKLAIKLS